MGQFWSAIQIFQVFLSPRLQCQISHSKLQHTKSSLHFRETPAIYATHATNKQTNATTQHNKHMMEHTHVPRRPCFKYVMGFRKLFFSYVSSKLEVIFFAPGCQSLDLPYLQRASTDYPFSQHQIVNCQQRQPESRSVCSPSVLNSYRGHAGLIYFYYGWVEMQVYKSK